MMPVTPLCGPPAGFALKVLKPAKRWAKNKGWGWTQPPPQNQAKELPAYWTRFLNELHNSHAGICTYLSVYMHRAMDGSTVDHYEPKSKVAISKAYDWSNYRLASRPMNTNKGEHQDVLDPYTLPPGLFILNLLSGRIRIDKTIAPAGSPLHQSARATLARLKINQGEYRQLRIEYINEYIKDAANSIDLAQTRQDLFLKSPFIHYEMARQNGWP